MIYRVPVSVLRLKEGGFIARCKDLRATATGETAEEAIRNLREAIEDMVKEYGPAAVFQDRGDLISPCGSCCRAQIFVGKSVGMRIEG